MVLYARNDIKCREQIAQPQKQKKLKVWNGIGLHSLQEHSSPCHFFTFDLNNEIDAVFIISLGRKNQSWSPLYLMDSEPKFVVFILGNKNSLSTIATPLCECLKYPLSQEQDFPVLRRQLRHPRFASGSQRKWRRWKWRTKDTSILFFCSVSILIKLQLLFYDGNV